MRSRELPIIGGTPPADGGVRPSKTSRWRAAALITLNVLMALHILQWWLMGTTVSPIEPSEAMYTIQQGALNAGFIFFSLAILATLIFGRFVCGWGCHVVALQDLCGWLLKKMGIKPVPFRSRLLIYVPLIAAIYMFIWPTVVRYFSKPPEEPLIPQFTNHLLTTDFWATFPPVLVAIPFLFICGFVTVYFLGQKGFCTYGCPYGGFFAVADKVAPGKIRVTDACNQCGHCTATCTSNVKVHAEVKRYGMVVDPGCMKCMDCVSVCPNEALYFGFGKPSVSVKKSVRANYSLTWNEEIAGVIVFVGSLFAVWNVYQLVPMLMALGISIVTTFLVLKAWRLVTRDDVTFHRFALRSSGSFKIAGWIFLAFAVGWAGLVAHSGVVRYFESRAARAFEAIAIPDELALADANPGQWLGASDLQYATAGKRSFDSASGLSLFDNKEAISKRAWIEYLLGNNERALELLAEAAEKQSGSGGAISRYYRGAILNRMGRHEEALREMDAVFSERPDLSAAREEKGVALWKLGRTVEAVSIWSELLEMNPALPFTASFLSGAATADGRTEDASRFESVAAPYIPNDARFHWVLGLRLQEMGMGQLAEKHFGQAVRRNPAFMIRRKRSP
ncbi:MAG TPA: 4Fe-4S binding protein [Pyrinomonadaceae bacterium]|nr:4Fe-4S binding protein [Pyrinomonadaceae bacterium]HMP65218.1 4Fe-4S binding protein [Pyrinomonadaceae bacterium]